MRTAPIGNWEQCIGAPETSKQTSIALGRKRVKRSTNSWGALSPSEKWMLAHATDAKWRLSRSTIRSMTSNASEYNLWHLLVTPTCSWSPDLSPGIWRYASEQGHGYSESG